MGWQPPVVQAPQSAVPETAEVQNPEETQESELELAQRKCRDLLEGFSFLLLKGNDFRMIKFASEYNLRIKQAVTVDDADELYKQLTGILGQIGNEQYEDRAEILGKNTSDEFLVANLSENEILEFQKLELLQQFDKYKVSHKDPGFDAFIKRTNTRFEDASPLMAKQILNELKTLLSKLDKSGQLDDVKKRRDELRKEAVEWGGLTTIGKNKKAQAIEDALCQVPIEERATVLDNAGVEKALASHRKMAWAKEKISDITGIEWTPAESFTDLKKKYQKVKDDADPAKDPDDDSSPIPP